MTSVKWLSRITLRDEPYDGYQMRHSYRSATRRTSRASRSRPSRRGRCWCRRDPRVHVPRPHARARAVRARRPCVVGRSGDRCGRRLHGRRRELVARAARRRLARPRAWRSWRFSWDAEPGEQSSAVARAMRRVTNSPLSPPGTSAATRTTPSSACASPFTSSQNHEARLRRAPRGETGLRPCEVDNRAYCRARARRAPDSNRNRLASAALAVDHASRLGIPPSDAGDHGSEARRTGHALRSTRHANGTRS